MPMKGAESATNWQEIDRFEREGEAGASAGFSWIAYPDEKLQRTSHALAIDGEVWVIDPVDADGIDDALAELGEVAGVVVLLDRHKRDSAALANRHDVPVYIPDFFDIEDEFDAPVEKFHRELADTGYAVHKVVDNFAWSEAALYGEDDGTLVVPEAVGTVDFFRAGSERLGVHPALRLKPPKKLARLNPERILVGHGAGIHDDAAAVLDDAVSGSRARTPGLYLKTLKTFLPG